MINFDNIIGKNFNTITNNVFCLSYPKNCLIIEKKQWKNKHINEFNSSK